MSSTDFRTLFSRHISEGDIQLLEEIWKIVVREELKVGEEVSQVWFWRLVNLYSEQQRQYHTNKHLVQGLLRILEVLGDRESANYEKKSLVMLVLTLFFHDAIYFPMRKDNEEVILSIFHILFPKIWLIFLTFYQNSILLFLEFSGEVNLETSLSDQISNTIILTKKHLDAGLEDTEGLEQIFLDIDMSILGASQEDYKVYIDEIRREYSQMKDIQFQKGRLQFLKSLKNKKIYRSSRFMEMNEQAKNNIQWEIIKIETELDRQADL